MGGHSTQVLALLGVLCAFPLASCIDASRWTLASGFQVADYYTGGTPTLTNARSLALSGSSKASGPWITYVSSMAFDLTGAKKRSIYALVDSTGAGVADYAVTIVANISTAPNGIAWRNGALFIASLQPYKSCTIYRLDGVDDYALKKKATPAAPADLNVVLDNLPIDFWHGWKVIRFGPDGKLYVPVGANCNACRLDGKPPNNGTIDGKFIYDYAHSTNVSWVGSPYQKEATSPVWEFASIYRMSVSASGVVSNIEQFASGVRNTVGFDWDAKGRFYFTDNGRDDMGGSNITFTDNHPDCELNYAPTKGLNFGFPFCHTGPSGDNAEARPYLRLPGVGLNEVDPQLNPGESAMKCNGASLAFKPAVQAMGPHMAPLGIRFYKFNASQAAQFPQEYHNNAFVALHGSWNRVGGIGAKVVRVVFDPANPAKVLKYESFFSGGVPGDTGLPDGPNPPVDPSASYIGRPVDMLQLPDGSLLVSDDFVGAVYRISYNGASGCHTGGAQKGTARGSKQQLRRSDKKPTRSLLDDGNDDDNNGCGYGSDDKELAVQTVQGATKGCKVYLGDGVPLASYRRCIKFDMTGKRDYVALAYSLTKVNNNLVLNGALLGWDYANLNANGWMAIAVPKPGETDMVGANAIIARPLAGGAVAEDYRMPCTAWSCFTLSSGFVYNKAATLKAVIAGDALVATFSVFLNQTTGKKFYPLFAMGDVSATTGEPKQHWTTGYAKLDLPAGDVGAVVPDNVPVLNTRGMKPQGNLPPPPVCNATNSSTTPVCTINGVQYGGCTSTSDSGIPITLYFTKTGNTLKGAIKADTSSLGGNGGWASIAYTPSGGMRGADVLFVMPCASCQGGARAEAKFMTSYLYATFTNSTLFSGVATTKLPSGELLATFSATWKPGTYCKMQIRYGGGPYTEGAGQTGTLSKHLTYPPLACVAPTGGVTAVGAGC